MLRETLRKVVGEEKYDTKRRLKETDDLAIIVDGMNEIELRQLASKYLPDALAWGEPLDTVKTWYLEYR